MIHTKHKGFTMIEMIVVLGIFGVVSSIVLFNYSKFRSDTILTNMAYEVALTIREAQIYGTSVRSPSGSTPRFSDAYGVFVPNLSTNNQYVLFADDGDNVYDGDSCTNYGDDICVTPYTVLGSIQISQIDIEKGSGNCPPTSDSLSVIFKRPNPEPVINNDDTITRAQITLSSQGSSAKRYVLISNNGQVSVVNESICVI